MRVNIVPIGNSRGIRIPKALLKLCHIHTEVELDVKGNSIVIHPAKRKPREGWEESFKSMHANKDDALLIEDSQSLIAGDWEW